MKTETLEHKAVRYFVQRKEGDIWVQPYVNTARTYRQMKQSARVLRFFVICFFLFLLIPLPFENDSVAKLIAGYLWVISFAGMFLFGLITIIKFLMHAECKDDCTTRDLLEHFDSFRKLFGKYPGQLGPRKIDKKLAKHVKKIIALESKNGDTYHPHKQLRVMYDTAQMFAPVHTYAQLFESVREKRELPDVFSY